MITDFDKKVFSILAEIPRGKITTYKFIADKLGIPGAARAVGNSLNKNETLIKIPCHRVINSNGRVGGYKLGQIKKIKILEQEGIKVKNGSIQDFKKLLYKFK